MPGDKRVPRGLPCGWIDRLQEIAEFLWMDVGAIGSDLALLGASGRLLRCRARIRYTRTPAVATGAKKHAFTASVREVRAARSITSACG